MLWKYGMGMLTKDNLHLGARKRLGYAPVRAEAKAQRVVVIRRAVHVEDVRVREDLFVAISGGVGRDYALACLDDLQSSQSRSSSRG